MDEKELVELITLAQAGDREAFGEIARHFDSTIFAIVMRRLQNYSEAKEVTQDVFVQAMRKLEQLREPERFAGWIKQIAVRMSINKAIRRPPVFQSASEVIPGVADEQESPLEKLLKSERAVQLNKGLTRLRDLDRETLIAFYFEGNSLKEMSDSFQSPIGTIKRRLHTARNRLREELQDLQLA